MDDKEMLELRNRLAKANSLKNNIAAYKQSINEIDNIEQLEDGDVFIDIAFSYSKGTLSRINFDRHVLYNIFKDIISFELQQQLSKYEEEFKNL